MTNVLVVEDDKPSGLILKKLLDKSGYNVTYIVETGEEAINTINDKRPDIVLMDISLAGSIDGIEAAEKIYQTYNIPFIYITAGTDGHTFERAKKSMPLNYIVKPFNMQILSSSIEMALYKFDMENKLRQSEEYRKKILESIPDTIFELNMNGTPCTPADEEIMNRLWPPDIRDQALKHIQQNSKNDTIGIFEFSSDRKDKTIYYESRIIKTSDNIFIIMTRDISAKKNEELEVSRQVNELEDAIKERTGELQKINRTLMDEIDKRNLAEEEIKLFLDVVEQSTSVIVIIDKNGRVKYTNNAFSVLSGYSKEELIDLDTSNVPNPIMPEDINTNQIKDIDFWKGEMYNAKKTGEIYYLRTSISRIKNTEGKTNYIVISGEDITQSKKDAMTLEKMKDSLKNSTTDSIDKDMAWQAWKEKMLSRNISRTDRSIFSNINNSFTQGAGFGTLITFMEMISKSAVKKDDKFLVDESLFSEAMKNVKIAQDAFKIFAGIDWIISNKIDLETKTVREIYTIIKGIINKSQKFADYNKHRIVINDLPSGLKNQVININVQYFSEAFSELIINALKFSRTGTAIIVMLYSQANSLRISIINDPQKTHDGIVGIPDEYQKVVFEPFYRLSKLVYEKYNTLDFGIGLTFAEKIITRHGGEIFAENILDYSDIEKDPQTKVNLMISLPFNRD